MADAAREAQETAHRWHRRPTQAPSRWYTVAYDAQGKAWLVSEGQDRLCLEEGMQIDVAQIALARPFVPTRAKKRKQGA
jgi:hypothetical protein